MVTSYREILKREEVTMRKRAISTITRRVDDVRSVQAYIHHEYVIRLHIFWVYNWRTTYRVYRVIVKMKGANPNRMGNCV